MKTKFARLLKKQIRSILIVLVLCGVVLVIHEQKTIRDIKNTTITFQDKNLEQVIRTNINKPTGPLLKGDVDTIKELSVRKKNISNVSGIQNLTNLIHLDLSFNKIDNIEPIRGLTSLVDLHLNSNQIDNIKPLSGLTNLIGLYLGSNPIKDYSPISSYYKNLQDKDFTSY